MFHWKKTAIILMLSLLISGTAYATPQVEGGAAGGIIGGIAGALLDHKNPWRGGVIGAGLGAITGATLTDISVRGAQEAAQSGRPVEYRTDNGQGGYRAEPVGAVYYPDEYTKCRKVHEKTWENGSLVQDTIREVCEGERTEGGYGTPLAYDETPPVYETTAQPSVVLIPGTYVYAAPYSGTTLLYYDGYWWRPIRGYWYRSGHYNGPWGCVRFDRVPHSLRELPPDYPRMLPGRHRVAYGEMSNNWGRGERPEGWRRGPGERWEEFKEHRGRERRFEDR